MSNRFPVARRRDFFQSEAIKGGGINYAYWR